MINNIKQYEINCKNNELYVKIWLSSLIAKLLNNYHE